MYNIAYSTIKDYKKELVWLDEAENEITYYQNYHPRYIIDYDKNTYTWLKTGSDSIYSIKFSFNDSITSNCFYMSWKELQNCDYVIWYGSDDETTWTDISIESVYGDVVRVNSTTVSATDSTDGKMFITFNSDEAWNFYRIVFVALGSFPNSSLLQINSAWFGKQLDIIEMDLDKSYNYGMYGITRNKSFDGTVWTSVYGSEAKAEWELKWSIISNEEKIESESFINELLYNPKILLWNTTSGNTWYECLQDSEEISFVEEQAYLWNWSLSLKEL